MTNDRDLPVNYVSFFVEDVIHIQSQLFLNGVPYFVVRIFSDLRFECFHYGVRCMITSLSKNRISKVTTWSILDEIINFLNVTPKDNQLNIIHEQLQSMSYKPVGKPVYSHEIIVRTFDYFATRSLYNKLSLDYKLPSVETLTRITSKHMPQKFQSLMNHCFLTMFLNL